MDNYILLCIVSLLLSPATSGDPATPTTLKPSTTTPSLTPDNVRHIADYCLESDGNPKMVLSSTETLDSMKLVSAWGSGEQWDFYSNPCTLTITVPEDHGVVMGVEYWSYREEDYSHEKTEAKSSDSCNKLKVEYTGSSGSAIKESTEICTNQMQASTELTANGRWALRKYQLLSSYDHNMKIIFYDNDENDNNDNDYYITLTAARRDSECGPNEFQCIEYETSGVPHCVHRDLLCDGHVNCATVTEPFDEIFKNCLTNETKAIFHGVDISIQPWYTGIALRYFLVLCLIISVFFMFVACYFCPKYAARRRTNQLMRQSRVSIVPLPTTTNDAKAAEAAAQTQQHDLPPYEATVQTPPDYKSLFLPLQINPPARSNTESQS